MVGKMFPSHISGCTFLQNTFGILVHTIWASKPANMPSPDTRRHCNKKRPLFLQWIHLSERKIHRACDAKVKMRQKNAALRRVWGGGGIGMETSGCRENLLMSVRALTICKQMLPFHLHKNSAYSHCIQNMRIEHMQEPSWGSKPLTKGRKFVKSCWPRMRSSRKL